MILDLVSTGYYKQYNGSVLYQIIIGNLFLKQLLFE